MYIAHGWLPLLSYDLVNTHVGIECMGSARAYVLRPMSYVPGDIRHKTKYREGCFIHIVRKRDNAAAERLHDTMLRMQVL